MKKIGFIGAGNMASAIIGGVIASGKYAPSEIIASAKHKETCDRVSAKYGIETSTDNCEAAAASEIVILAVKPYQFDSVCPEIKNSIPEDAIVVSIAAGITLAKLSEYFPKHRVVRVMPNTPALVGEAMSAVCGNGDQADAQKVKDLFGTLGKASIITEKQMDAVIGVSGSSPAFVYMMIEAMADAAVAEGLPRADALTFASQAVLGSAKMVLETGEHPGRLKDNVCSPGGTTIEGVAALEANGFRNSVISAVRAAAKKSKEMSN